MIVPEENKQKQSLVNKKKVLYCEWCRCNRCRCKNVTYIKQGGNKWKKILLYK